MLRLHAHHRNAFILALVVWAGGITYLQLTHTTSVDLFSSVRASTTIPLQLPFHYAFSVNGKLDESGSMDKSTSPYWWLNSGAYMYLKNGKGMTIQGDLPTNDKRRISYAAYNPGETDDGYRPQNIFRLILRTVWKDIAQSAYFKINYYKLSTDPHRSESNGILLFNRYMDGNNTYYAGLRVDGYAVIKKKKNGTYYTLAYKPVIGGPKYDRTANPNLLPIDTWIGLKTEVKNLDERRVSIKVYADIGKTNQWQLVAEAIDDGATYGGGAHTQEGNAGIRTDFMDAEFDDYRLTGL